MHTHHCNYWSPGAKAPGHQYPQCLINIHCIVVVSYRNSIFVGNNIKDAINFCKQIPSCLRVKFCNLVKRRTVAYQTSAQYAMAKLLWALSFTLPNYYNYRKAMSIFWLLMTWILISLVQIWPRYRLWMWHIIVTFNNQCCYNIKE